MKGNLTDKEFDLQQELLAVDKKYHEQTKLLDKLKISHLTIRDKIFSSIRERHFEECNRLFIRYFSDNQ